MSLVQDSNTPFGLSLSKPHFDKLNANGFI
jgi:hypothetical protein